MGAKPNILLIEDEENIALAIELLLAREGYALLRVTDGTQALPNIRAQMPDLVLLDVTLPGRSGYDICQSMRLDPRLKDIPVLMMSARTAPTEQRKGLAMGANAFLTKPFTMDHLKRMVADLIAGGTDED